MAPTTNVLELLNSDVENGRLSTGRFSRCIRFLYSHSIQCKVYSHSVQCTLFSVQCTLLSLLYTLCSLQCTLFCVQCTVIEECLRSKSFNLLPGFFDHPTRNDLIFHWLRLV